MANTLTYLRKKKSVGNTVTKVFQCLLSGSYVQSSGIGTPGETLAFNSATLNGYPERPETSRRAQRFHHAAAAE